MLGGDVFQLVRGSAYFLFLVHRFCNHVYIHCAYVWWCMSSSPILTCVVFFLSLYTCFYLYTIYYFCFTQRCLDEFCLKYFRNTCCQSLLAINSLLTKFFKSLCYDRFYYIQQVNMSLMIYDFSHMFICLLWFCHGLPNGRLLRHMWFTC